MNIAKRIGFTPTPYTKENKTIDTKMEYTIVFDTTEEAQEMVMLLEALRLESGAWKTPEEWEKVGFKITTVKTKPSIAPRAIITDILSDKDYVWICAELRNNNLPYGSYFAFEQDGSTYLYRYGDQKKCQNPKKKT